MSAAAPEPQVGAHVTSSDGHDLGTISEVTTDEIFVLTGHVLKRTMSFRRSDIARATPQHVTIALDNATIVHGTWNVVTLRDVHGRDRHITQVGVAPVVSVPQYDESQTTTGGPPTGEADR
jgi:hypothetical protein